MHQGSLPRRLTSIALYAMWAAVLARTLSVAEARQWPWYIAGFAGFLVIQLFVDSPLHRTDSLVHVALAVQAAITLVLFSIDTGNDWIAILFALECYGAAVAFRGLPRTLWITALVALIGLSSLAFDLGAAQGLARVLAVMAVAVVLSTFVVVTQEVDEERAASEVMVDDLRAAEERLTAYAERADELAAIEQRARVVRDLEASVTRTLEQVLDEDDAARILLNEPDKAGLRLERLQDLTAQALAQMRRVITELRPSQKG